MGDSTAHGPAFAFPHPSQGHRKGVRNVRIVLRRAQGTPMSGPNHPRGTTNRNDRGSSYARRARREYLVETYRANADKGDFDELTLTGAAALGMGTPACRCYRCGELLTVDTVTVDRVLPGCCGGTYRRDNIRPACSRCNSETGGKLAHHIHKRPRRPS